MRSSCRNRGRSHRRRPCRVGVFAPPASACRNRCCTTTNMLDLIVYGIVAVRLEPETRARPGSDVDGCGCVSTLRFARLPPPTQRPSGATAQLWAHPPLPQHPCKRRRRRRRLRRRCERWRLLPQRWASQRSRSPSQSGGTPSQVLGSMGCGHWLS